MLTRNSRRRFIISLVGFGCLALGWPRRAWPLFIPRKQAHLLSSTSILPKLLSHTASARIVGREYLQGARHDANLSTFLESLLCIAGYDPMNHTDLEMFRQHVQIRIRRDFEQARVIKIHGWILSLTEARLCALTAFGLPQTWP